MVTALPLRASDAGSGNKTCSLKAITPELHTVGRAQSHGCVRLTNWDIAPLAQMVSVKAQVVFEAKYAGGFTKALPAARCVTSGPLTTFSACFRHDGDGAVSVIGYAARAT